MLPVLTARESDCCAWKVKVAAAKDALLLTLRGGLVDHDVKLWPGVAPPHSPALGARQIAGAIRLLDLPCTSWSTTRSAPPPRAVSN